MSSVGFHNEFASGVSNPIIVPCPISPSNGRDLETVLDVGVELSEKKSKIFKIMNFCLVGKGEKGVNCGGYHRSHVCENIQCCKLHYAKNRCYRMECPDCYSAWKMRAVERIKPRIYSEKARIANRSRRLSHIIVSMKNSENVKTVNDFNEMIYDAYRFVDVHGLKGGVVIIHGYRATSEAKYLAHKAGKHTWEWIREQPHHERYMRYSPHFHFVGYYDYMEDGRGLGKKYEVNQSMQIIGDEDEKLLFKYLKNVGTKKDRDMEMNWIYKSVLKTGTNSIETFNRDEKGMEGLLHYLLSHTVAEEGGRFNSIRWFGNCSNRKFGVTEEEENAAIRPEMKEEYCKICGAPLISFRRWVRENYYHIMQGDVPEPKYFEEIYEMMNGAGPPPDAKDFVIGDVIEK